MSIDPSTEGREGHLSREPAARSRAPVFLRSKGELGLKRVPSQALHPALVSDEVAHEICGARKLQRRVGDVVTSGAAPAMPAYTSSLMPACNSSGSTLAALCIASPREWNAKITSVLQPAQGNVRRAAYWDDAFTLESDTLLGADCALDVRAVEPDVDVFHFAVAQWGLREVALQPSGRRYSKQEGQKEAAHLLAHVVPVQPKLVEA